MRDAAAEGLKVAPPVAVSVATFVGGWTINEWVMVATLIYTVLAIVHKVATMVRDWRKK